MKTIIRMLVVASALLAVGCAGVKTVQQSKALEAGAQWVMLPVINWAEVPQAGERSESIVGTVLRARGVRSLAMYPAEQGDALPELNDRSRYERAVSWAREQQFRYGVTGTVEEWQYKSGLDGEPAIGLTVQVVDMSDGRVLWSASGAKSGWGYGTLSGTAQKLVRELLEELPLR